MKKRMTAFLALTMLLLLLAGCGSRQTNSPAAPVQESAAPESAAQENAVQESTQPVQQLEETDSSQPVSDTLVIYFSRTGEQYDVGVIEKGNTAIVAEIIAEETGADTFEILPEADTYPTTYKELTEFAKQEQNDKARPAIAGPIPDLTGYRRVFIGAPVWWGDWPMILYTFFETADLSGKQLIPFSTHAGSGLSGFDSKLAAACPDSAVLEGLAIRGVDAQKDPEGVRADVEQWLARIDEQ